ncbi:MAG: HEAT repeat domain-containing protein [Planctomycetota bacterium]|nr:MAG: HEAT repeat domain-containing protein [Planctomycetota bacterium]
MSDKGKIGPLERSKLAKNTKKDGGDDPPNSSKGAPSSSPSAAGRFLQARQKVKKARQTSPLERFRQRQHQEAVLAKKALRRKLRWLTIVLALVGVFFLIFWPTIRLRYLRYLLCSGTPAQQQEAVESLLRLSSPKAATLLVEALDRYSEQSHPKLYARIAAFLQRYARKEMVPFLEKKLLSTRLEEQIQAAEAIGILHNKAFIQKDSLRLLLKQAFRNSSPTLRERIASSLAKIGRREDFLFFVQALLAYPFARLDLRDAVVQLADRENLPLLGPWLASKDFRKQKSALLALVFLAQDRKDLLKGASVLAKVSPLLHAAHPKLRSLALRALEPFFSASQLPQLFPLAEDPSPVVRERTVDILARFCSSSKNARRVLQTKLNDSSLWVRLKATLALAKTKDPFAVQQLLVYIQKPTLWKEIAKFRTVYKAKRAEFERKACQILGEISTIKARQALEKLLFSEDRKTRLNAIQALAKCQSPSSLPALKKRLNHTYGKKERKLLQKTIQKLSRLSQ